jgi:hypothetical protein
VQESVDAIRAEVEPADARICPFANDAHVINPTTLFRFVPQFFENCRPCDYLLRLTTDCGVSVKKLVSVMAKLGMIAAVDLYPSGILWQQSPVRKHPIRRRHAVVRAINLRHRYCKG